MDTIRTPVLVLLYLTVLLNAAVFKSKFEKRKPKFDKNFSPGFGKRGYFPGFGKRQHDSGDRLSHKNKQTSSHELKIPYLDTDPVPEWKELEVFYPNSYESYSLQKLESGEDYGEPDSVSGYLLNSPNLLPYGTEGQEQPFIEDNDLRGIMPPTDVTGDSRKMYNGFPEKIKPVLGSLKQNGYKTKGIAQLLKKILSQRGKESSYPSWQ